MSTLLLWRLGALGDTLLLMPAMAALRAAFPTHSIVAAGQTTALAPAVWSNVVDRVLDATASSLSPLATGNALPPGALPEDIDLAIVWSAHRAAMRRGLSHAGARRVIAAPALPSSPKPMAKHYLDTLAPLGVAPAPFELRVPPAAIEATALLWREITHDRHDVIMLHAGAGSALKTWPLAHYLALANELRAGGATVVWTAGPADATVRTALEQASEIGATMPVLDIAGLAAILVRAAVVVSGDSGVAHLAALLGTRAVTLFGPTDDVTWAPPGRASTVLRLALPCSPCGDIARGCPSRICLRGLPVEAVLAAVRKHLDRRAADVSPEGWGTVPRAEPWPPEACHPPVPAHAPPGALPLGMWANGRMWGAEWSTARR